MPGVVEEEVGRGSVVEREARHATEEGVVAVGQIHPGVEVSTIVGVGTGVL